MKGKRKRRTVKKEVRLRRQEKRGKRVNLIMRKGGRRRNEDSEQIHTKEDRK